MKEGDLVRYVSDDTPSDDVIGLVISTSGTIITEPPGRYGDGGWAEVIWSLESGPHRDAVPMTSLKVVNEVR